MKVLLATGDFAEYFKVMYPDLDIVPTRPSKKMECDLLIFTGGEDVNPMEYGENAHPTVHYNASRDRKEKNVYSYFRNNIVRAKKVLGVCRGIQILNVVQGGTLYQDLNSIGKGHRGSHEIKWEDGTTDLLNKLTQVNSLHHQAVQYIPRGSGGTILATEPNTGVVESVLWKDNILGVQFHPEFFPTGSEIKKYFLEAMERWVSGESLFNSKRDSSKEEESPSRKYARIKYIDASSRGGTFDFSTTFTTTSTED